MNLEENIRHKLQEIRAEFEEFEHDPVYTNPELALAIGVPESDTVKSLVLKTKEGKFVVMVLPGDKKLDWKAAAKAAGSKKVSFAKPEDVAALVGCEVGAVPPFGHKEALEIVLDSLVSKKKRVYFNPGVHHKTFAISGRDLKAACS